MLPARDGLRELSRTMRLRAICMPGQTGCAMWHIEHRLTMMSIAWAGRAAATACTAGTSSCARPRRFRLSDDDAIAAQKTVQTAHVVANQAHCAKESAGLGLGVPPDYAP